MIVEWDVAKKDSTTVRTTTTADALVRKDATSMKTMTMATANALARKNAISMTGMRKNIIVKTAATMITA
ncbi:hypothetical protein [Priestia megaterium]|uniref:hypothetical protein n=1 Tax=Priestia megaterium TaxID=1404 RepID=UPI000BF7C1BA|nr:hypothetical protein [Priestia megaterium]MCM3152001.1 hypothetical protein [Priestia megaterium]PEU68944.1 hypothetical protein CN397_21345 [Priestia megaterium]PFQ87609.1 hypothetical protein COK11_02805 [Priestia megaterium]PFW53060.1 hypothetical protein COL17_02840 [Priestia megaterium]PGR08951.1 hypothetical protein COA23_08685 [Priestia megaterium]